MASAAAKQDLRVEDLGVVVIPSVDHLSILRKGKQVVVLVGEVHLHVHTQEDQYAYADQFRRLPSHIRTITIQQFITAVMADREGQNLFLEIHPNKNNPAIFDVSEVEKGVVYDLARWVVQQKEIKPHWIDARSEGLFNKNWKPLASEETNPASQLLKWIFRVKAFLKRFRMWADWILKHPEELKTQDGRKQWGEKIGDYVRKFQKVQILKDVVNLTKGEFLDAILECLSDIIAEEVPQTPQRETLCELTWWNNFMTHGDLPGAMERIKALLQNQLTIEDVEKNATLVSSCIGALIGLEIRFNGFLVDVSTVKRLHKPYVETAVVYMGAAHTALTESILVELGYAVTHTQHANGDEDIPLTAIDMETVESAMSVYVPGDEVSNNQTVPRPKQEEESAAGKKSRKRQRTELVDRFPNLRF